MQPIAQIFNLAAIVCEPTYDLDFVSLALIGIGHEKILTATQNRDTILQIEDPDHSRGSL